jgi:hypothetical protein
LLLSLIGGAYWMWHTAKVESQRSQTELVQMIALDKTVDHIEQKAPFSHLVFQATPEHRRQTQQDQGRLLTLSAKSSTANVTVEDITWRGEFAIVQVRVSELKTIEPGLGYRQTRFYQRTASGWARTAPTATLWGPVQSIQTRNFTLLFGEPDRPVVMTVAASLDQQYMALREDFGLPAVDPAEQLTIEVAVTGESPAGFTAGLRGKRLVVTSPALLPIADELSATDVLAHHIVAALTTHMAETTASQGMDAWEWHNLVIAVYRWQLWQHNAAFRAWHNQVTAWLYSIASTNSSPAATDVSASAAALCRKAAIFEASAPSGVPVLLPWCAKQEHQLIRWNSAFQINQLAAPTTDWITQGDVWPDWYHYKPLETLIDYAVLIYGRDRLPVLLAALPHHHRWETLIPAVFNVSAAEFERGWQAYLRARYQAPNYPITASGEPARNGQ